MMKQYLEETGKFSVDVQRTKYTWKGDDLIDKYKIAGVPMTQAMADAKMDSVPIIAITGQVSTPVIGTDAFQETPIVEVCRAITKHHYLIQRTEDITRVLKEAFHIASTGRPGPIIIDIPKDVQLREIVPDWDVPMNLPGYRLPPQANKNELQRVIEEIRRAKRPVVYGGGGIGTGRRRGRPAHARRTPCPRGAPGWGSIISWTTRRRST